MDKLKKFFNKLQGNPEDESYEDYEEYEMPEEYGDADYEAPDSMSFDLDSLDKDALSSISSKYVPNLSFTKKRTPANVFGSPEDNLAKLDLDGHNIGQVAKVRKASDSNKMLYDFFANFFNDGDWMKGYV